MAITKKAYPEIKTVDVEHKPVVEITNPCPRCCKELKATSGKGLSGTDYHCDNCGINITK